MLAAKKAVKVTFLGETKRLKLSGVYLELIQRTRTAFKNVPQEIKFFYLDEDNEIISISSQSDYTEALEIGDLGSLRLIVASSVQDARKQLVTQLEDARPLAESLNSSQIMSQMGGPFGNNMNNRPPQRDFFMAGESEFDSISHSDLAQSMVDRRHTMQSVPNLKMSHEIGIGSSNVMCDAGAGTDTMPRVEAACNTQRVQTSEKMIDTCVEMNTMGTQASSKVRDQGCDGIIATMQHQASQMMSEMKDVDVTCDLLIPSDDEDVAEVACIKCNGSQMNKKGLPCRKCNGRGTLVSKELSEIQAIVRQEVEQFCYQSFRGMFTDYLVDKKEKQDATLHEKVICDGCEANPIRGIRYMCSVCSDCDFCQQCEKNGVHAQHPLLKIRKEEQAPAKLICQFKNQRAHVVPQQNNFINTSNAQVWERNQQSAKKEVRYSARFIKENFPDKTQIEQNAVFCKTWWVRNDGEVAWPAGTKLLQTSGDDISATVVDLKVPVPAGETFEFSVMCKAPAKLGQYNSHFRLQTGKIKFGHRLSNSILVVEAKPEEIDAEDAFSLLSNPVQKTVDPVSMVPQEAIVEVAADKEIAQPEKIHKDEVAQKVDEPMVEDEKSATNSLMQSTISIDAKSPKQVYMEAAEAEEDKTLSYALKSLYEFGFTNFSINKVLMQKHKDINVVAETLMTGALSESQFNQILH